MASQDKLFLVASVDASNGLTGLFDFVWPTAVALWNFQWQTKGFLAQMPDATVDDLNSRFVLGSGIRGANLLRLAKEHQWPEMQQWFARLLLAETCALFEGWVEAVLDELSIPAKVKRSRTRDALDKLLQFPTSYDANGVAISGVRKAIGNVCGVAGSAFIRTCFRPTQLRNRKCNEAALESLLVCYRTFKEARNDFTHHGGRASQKSIDALAKYQQVTAHSMGVKELPEFPAVNLGEPTRLSLRGVVGFTDVVVRLIATLDLLLTDSPFAEQVIVNRWIQTHLGRITVKPLGDARDAQVAKLVRQCGLPSPVAPRDLFDKLAALQLVF